MPPETTVFAVFSKCVHAIRASAMIRRESRHDKEFHFQNWVLSRLKETKFQYETGGRNTYPDFRMVQFTEGYEVKGLAYPGRDATYDNNSQVPSGYHNGRTVFYVFGRYPKRPDGNTYPVLDLVICHGDFLNADHEYVHENKHVRGFGSYGDIMIRDRKMYVAPTPFRLLSGVAHLQTLILPTDFSVPKTLKMVGTVVRRETEKLIVGYRFDLEKNLLAPEMLPNPSAGREHDFGVWRLDDGSDESVALKEVNTTVGDDVENYVGADER